MHVVRRTRGEIVMSFRTILVPIEQHDLMSSTLETALCLARKFDSYIEGFALRVAHHPADALLHFASRFSDRAFHAIFVHNTFSGYFDKSLRELRAAIPIRMPTPTATASANNGRRPVSSAIRYTATVPSFAAALPSAAD